MVIIFRIIIIDADNAPIMVNVSAIADGNSGTTTYPLAIPFLDRVGTDCPVLCKPLIFISNSYTSFAGNVTVCVPSPFLLQDFLLLQSYHFYQVSLDLYFTFAFNGPEVMASLNWTFTFDSLAGASGLGNQLTIT